MTDIAYLKNAARVVYDESGKPVVQIPLSLWQEWLAQLEPESSQIAQINALMQTLANESDDTPAEWWSEFRQFLEENRLNFEGDLDVRDE